LIADRSGDRAACPNATASVMPARATAGKSNKTQEKRGILRFGDDETRGRALTKVLEARRITDKIVGMQAATD
jgi:hypothetical protein